MSAKKRRIKRKIRLCARSFAQLMNSCGKANYATLKTIYLQRYKTVRGIRDPGLNRYYNEVLHRWGQ